MEIAKTIAPVCLAIIMFGLGLGLTLTDFKRVITIPRDFIIGFLGQVIILPIIAFILIHIISMSPEIAIGVMVIAAAPGGVTSNILTKFANGDVALSVTLTAVVSLLSVITVPLIVYNSASFLGFEITKEISMINIAVKMFFVVTVPVIFGMIVRSLMTDFIISKSLLVQFFGSSYHSSNYRFYLNPYYFNATRNSSWCNDNRSSPWWSYIKYIN